jgi:hypothetical protein
MAARRERERRRPSADRTYRFGSPEAAVKSDEELAEAAAATNPDEAAARALDQATRRSRASRGATADGQSAAVATRPGHQSYADFQQQYAYVLSDLKRVGVVIGSLLLALIVLYFVLPH